MYAGETKTGDVKMKKKKNIFELLRKDESSFQLGQARVSISTYDVVPSLPIEQQHTGKVRKNLDKQLSCDRE